MPRSNKVEAIGKFFNNPFPKRLLLDMYLSGLSCKEIKEDIDFKTPSIIHITERTISQIIRELSKIDCKDYIRNKTDSYNLAIKKGRRTYKIKENKYKRHGLTLKTRYAILKRDDFKCCSCGNKEYLEIDHIIPVSKGGKNEEENLQTLCYYCNRGKFESEK
jgi:hypothetical protein